jgi:hypothetical protein
MGDCNFPRLKAVRDKYQYPVCEVGDDNEVDALKTKEAIEDIIKIISEENGN